MGTCHLSRHQILRLINLIDSAISACEGFIETHNDFLRSLSEEDVLHLNDYEMYFSDCLDEDILLFRELKLCLERGLK